MRLLNLQDYFLRNSYQYFEMVVYCAVGFFVPFVIGHPQIAVGIIVNAMLVTSALNLKGWKIVPIIILPSLAMLSRGLLFGPFTIYLVYLIPFIWIGNLILVLSFKWFKLKFNRNYWLTLVLGALFKSGFLFLAAFGSVQQKKIYWGKEVPDGWNGNWPAEFQTIPEKTNYEKTTSSYHSNHPALPFPNRSFFVGLNRMQLKTKPPTPKELKIWTFSMCHLLN